MGGLQARRMGITRPAVRADEHPPSAGVRWIRVIIIMVFFAAVMLILAIRNEGVLP